MLKIVALAFLLSLTTTAFADPPKWGLGMGLESRLQKEVNPGFSDVREVGVLFQEMRWGHWGALAEIGRQQNRTASGALEIASESIYVGAWGRYSFFEPAHWSPFLTAGLGSYFERVTSTFGDENSTHHGHRLLMGLGGGISNVLWNYLLFEGEVRGTVEQDRVAPGASLILRAGVQI